MVKIEKGTFMWFEHAERSVMRIYDVEVNG